MNARIERDRMGSKLRSERLLQQKEQILMRSTSYFSYSTHVHMADVGEASGIWCTCLFDLCKDILFASVSSRSPGVTNYITYP